MLRPLHTVRRRVTEKGRCLLSPPTRIPVRTLRVLHDKETPCSQAIHPSTIRGSREGVRCSQRPPPLETKKTHKTTSMGLCRPPTGQQPNNTDLLLPQLADGHVHVAVLLHNLRNRHLEVLLGHVDASLPKREHPGLCAHRLQGENAPVRGEGFESGWRYRRFTNCKRGGKSAEHQTTEQAIRNLGGDPWPAATWWKPSRNA